MFNISVRGGIVTEVFDNGAGVTFRLEKPAAQLSIGAIPSRSLAGAAGPMPVDQGEYIVVATSKSALRPLTEVLLAYRRPRGEVQAANFRLAALGAVAGGMGIAASALADTVSDGIAAAVVSSVVLVAAVLRLLAVHKAKIALSRWREPDGT